MKRNSIHQHAPTAVWALINAVHRTPGKHGRLRRFMEDLLFTAVLAMALSRFINTGALPYPVFLLAGLAPWFYTKELLQDCAKLPTTFGGLLAIRTMRLPLLVFSKAIAALPTLLFWMIVALAAAAIAGIQLRGLLMLPAIICCSILHGFTQGLAAASMAAFAENSNASAILLQMLFWTTPIAWPSHVLPAVFLFFAKLNPLFFIVSGMRGLMTGGILPDATHTLLFLAGIVGTGIYGIIMARRISAAALPQRAQAENTINAD